MFFSYANYPFTSNTYYIKWSKEHIHILLQYTLFSRHTNLSIESSHCDIAINKAIKSDKERTGT
jgi:hypothetical protein